MNNDSGIAAPLLIDILNTYMQLPAKHAWVRDQNVLIPNDTGLYVVVGLVNAPKVISAVTDMEQRDIPEDPDADPPVLPGGIQQVEVGQVYMREDIQIDIFSRSNEATTRNWEVIAALNSIYSKQVQEKNYFKIFRITSGFMNTSGAEGGSNINRYTLTFPCFVWYRKERALTETGGDYYDDFHQRVDDANTIGTDKPLIEFEITPEGIDP